MKVYREIGLEEFTPWNGGVSTWEKLRDNDCFDLVDEMIQICYPEGIGETELNDILWFDTEWLSEITGIEF